MNERHTIIYGIGVSTDTASAEVVKVSPAPGADTKEPSPTDPVADGERVREATANVAESLKKQAECSGPKARPILEATAQLASDRAFTKAVVKKPKAGFGVTQAVRDAVEDYAQLLTSLGGYTVERVTDLYDVHDRAIYELRGLPKPNVPDITTSTILLADDLAPAETAGLDPELVVGIATAGGGPTSHTAILAVRLGIPAVVKTKGVMELGVGTFVVTDGGAGEVIANPTAGEVAELEERARRRGAALSQSVGAGKTADGYPVGLLANIGTVEDGESAAVQDNEGTGLFRTEFLFLDRDKAPSLEEQTGTYTRVLKVFDERQVVMRTLDTGTDKPPSFADLGEEENPALGCRGLRLSQAREDLLDTQLDALAVAFDATSRKADLRVMAPMTATVEEIKRFADKARERGLPKVGVVIEVPTAAIRAKQLLSIVDFVSIGTNDLSQYTMAAGRMQGALAGLLPPRQPAVLRMIKSVCKGSNATDKPISVCGETGGDPPLALALVGPGMSSLSMASKKVPAVRAALRLHDRATCQQMAAYAIDAEAAIGAKAAVTALMDPKVEDLLWSDGISTKSGVHMQSA